MPHVEETPRLRSAALSVGWLFMLTAYFRWWDAAAAAARHDRIVAMVSLETIGYYTNEPGSQRYPPPLNLVYPDRGNFIGFVANPASRSLVRRALAVFRRSARFPYRGRGGTGADSGKQLVGPRGVLAARLGGIHGHRPPRRSGTRTTTRRPIHPTGSTTGAWRG